MIEGEGVERESASAGKLWWWYGTKCAERPPNKVEVGVDESGAPEFSEIEGRKLEKQGASVEPETIPRLCAAGRMPWLSVRDKVDLPSLSIARVGIEKEK